MNWISIKERLPNKKEQEANWKFLVCNIKDKWADSAYFNNRKRWDKWNNGECVIAPTHWACFADLPKE